MSYARAQAILAVMYGAAAGLNLWAAIDTRAVGYIVAAFVWGLATGVQAGNARDAS